MSLSNISNPSFVQPSVAVAPVRTLQNQPLVSEVSNMSLPEIAAKYRRLFVDPTGTSYPELETGALKRLGYILDQGDKYSDNIDKLSEIYVDLRAVRDRDSERICEETIDMVCREGYMALRFYAKSVADYLKALHAYIGEAREALEKLQGIIDLPETSEYEKTQRAQMYIDKLSIYENFCAETVDSLVHRHQYNNDTKQWEIISDAGNMLMTDNDGRSLLYSYRKYGDFGKLEDLRKTPIQYRDYRAEGGLATAPIQVFSSLPMLDRLKYIYYYYKLIIADGDDRYTNFPDDPENGYPCLPNIESIDPAKDTLNLGAMEMFYVGYLTDRDGPINAVSSFFEVKVDALRANLSLQSKKIEALNVYLEFINRGINVLNSSQSGAKNNEKDDKGKITSHTQHAIPDGAMIALTYLCGSEMYNLVAAEDGAKCLVIEDNTHPGRFMLVSADEAGMNFLLGDRGDVHQGRSWRGNCWSNLAKDGNGMWYSPNFSYAFEPTEYHFSTAIVNERWNNAAKPLGIGFDLPTKIDCTKVIPSSVRQYANFTNADEITTDVVSSWTTAFSNKTQFINTSIDTISTDIQVDRSKIDSFDSICSTFRSRAHEAHSNTAANVR